MVDTIPPTATAADPHSPSPSNVQSNAQLTRLLARTAAGDHDAFRRLYAGMALPIWLTVTASLRHPDPAAAVIHATFVEVWWLARSADRTGGTARAWLTAIAARRTLERFRAGRGPTQSPATEAIADTHDEQLHHELLRLLGGGRATIRVAAGAFLSVDDLDQAITRIAAARSPIVSTVDRTFGTEE